jgi:hypothetical protein
MKARRPKVIISRPGADPPGVGGVSPLEARQTGGRPRAAASGKFPGSPYANGLDALEAIQAAEKREHDRWVAGLPEEIHHTAAQDLGRRRAWNRKDHEQRWVMGRFAAHLRALDRMNREAMA